jgi:hypothetical protein
MPKKTMVIIVIVIFLFLSLKFALSAPKYSGEDVNPPDFSERFRRLETKLETLSKNIDSANKELARKLDQVLNNQEKIFSELAIIKVRASKR